MTGTLFPTAITTFSQSPLLICPMFPARVSKSCFNLHFFPPGNFHHGINTTRGNSEGGIDDKHWDFNFMSKEEEDGSEIDLIDYVNPSEQEEDKIPKNSSNPSFCLYKFLYRFNGLKD
jgi:hypothetical protein